MIPYPLFLLNLKLNLSLINRPYSIFDKDYVKIKNIYLLFLCFYYLLIFFLNFSVRYFSTFFVFSIFSKYHSCSAKNALIALGLLFIYLSF